MELSKEANLELAMLDSRVGVRLTTGRPLYVFVFTKRIYEGYE